MTDKVSDSRYRLFFVHSSIDDMGLTTDAFRVYAHLCRRVGNETNVAWPSYSAIGKVCFAPDATSKGRQASDEYCQKRAVAAVKELIDRGLISKTPQYANGHQSSNLYEITAPGEWTNSSTETATRGTNTSPIGGTNISPLKVLQLNLEGTPIKNLASDAFDHSPPEAENTIESGPNRLSGSLAASSTGESGTTSKPADKAPANTGVSGQQEMVGALARVCVLDPRLAGPRLGKAAKKLLAAGYTGTDVRGFADWWGRSDWRGQKGQPPDPEQVLLEIARSKLAEQPRGVGTQGRPNMRYEGNEVVVVPDDPWEP